MADRIYSRQFHAAEGGEAWRVLPDGAYAFFRTDSFSTSARFIDAISELIREGDEPSIDLRGDGVTVLIRAFKGRDYGLVQSDLDLARAISPFWQGVLGYDRRPDSPDEDLIDSHGRLAPFWFEEMDELRADGAGTIHLVVWVPWDEAEARVAAGLAAGGRMVRHNLEENFWTLADPAGNEVDVATTSAPEQAG